MKINAIVGENGEIIIPQSIRKNIGLEYNDVISFEQQDENAFLLKKEKVCECCDCGKVSHFVKPTDETTLLDFFDGLSLEEQRAVFFHLTMKFANMKVGDKNV